MHQDRALLTACFEIVDERGDSYQLLSNLFHRRIVPLDHREPAAEGTGYPKMAPEKIQQARRDIREYVDSFDYPRLQALVSNPDEIKNLYRRCRNGYEKLQVFRLTGTGSGPSGNTKIR